MRALVIDDSRTTRMILRGMLTRLGFEVSEAPNGEEALARLREIAGTAPILVTVDWNMPVMDGYDFVRAVRADHEFDKVPLIMVTAHSDPDSVVRALEAGANEYIMKPFDGDMVREKLELLGISVPH